MLCALFLPTNSTAAELFNSLNDYIGKLKSVILCQQMHSWSGCHGWMAFWFTTGVKEVTSECESMHCVIHREMLSSCKMSPELNNILQDVLKITNHIKVHALNSHLFAQLCEEMDAEHTCLLLYT